MNPVNLRNLALEGLIWGASLLTLMLLLPPLEPHMPETRFLVIGMAVSYYPAMAMHELAHTGVARWVGFEIAGLTIGPLQGRRTPDGWRLSWQPGRWLSGQSLAFPKKGRHAIGPMRAWAAAGPLMNLTAAALVYLVLIGPWTVPGAELLVAFLLTSLLLGVASLIPQVKALTESDGAMLLRLAGPQADAWAAYYSASQSTSVGGMSPADWPEEWLQAMENGIGSTGEACASMGYYGWLAQGRMAEATRTFQLWQEVRVASPLFQVQRSLEAAYFLAHHLAEVPSAKKALAEAETQLASCPAYPDVGHQERAQAAIALAEGNIVQASAWVAEGLLKIERFWMADPRGWATVERDLLMGLHQAIPAPPPPREASV